MRSHGATHDDGLDSDCDTLDGCRQSDRPRVAAGSTANEHLGYGLIAGLDLDGDGEGDLLTSSPGAGTGAGVIQLRPGPLGAPMEVTAAAYTGPRRTSGLGFAVTAGDGDGDGAVDVWITVAGRTARPASTGGRMCCRGRWTRGELRLPYGPVAGARAADDLPGLLGEATYASFGESVDAAGDVDGDVRLLSGGPR